MEEGGEKVNFFGLFLKKFKLMSFEDVLLFCIVIDLSFDDLMSDWDF